MGNQQFESPNPTPEQLAEWKKKEEEQCERERKYLHEFKLISVKHVKKQSDLTEEEVKLWKVWLKEEMGWPTPEDFTDLFDQESNFDFARDEIRVMKWEWQGQTLIDMNAWPGDNESGAVFLNGVIVFKNSDQSISRAEHCPVDLIERVDSCRHIRIQWCQEEEGYDNDHPAHQHCEKIKREYDRLKEL